MGVPTGVASALGTGVQFPVFVRIAQTGIRRVLYFVVLFLLDQSGLNLVLFFNLFVKIGCR